MELLVGTSKGVFKVDGGGKAAEIEPLRGCSVRAIVRLDGALIAGADDGLYRSTDGGHTWERTGAEGKLVWDILAAPDGSGAVLAGTEPAAVFRSTDGGRTWDEIESFRQVPGAERWCVPAKPPRPGRARTLVMDRAAPERLWVGVEVGGVVSSEDGGRSWRVDLPGNNPDIHVMAADPARPGVVFATTGYGRLEGVAEMIEGNAGFFRSLDGGASWEYRWQGMLPRYTRPMCVDPRPPHALTVACAPTAFSSYRDEGGAQALLYRSDDAGENWRSLCDEAHSPSSANFFAVAPAPQAAGDVIVGTDTGELWQVNSAGEWMLLVSGLPAVQAVA